MIMFIVGFIYELNLEDEGRISYRMLVYNQNTAQCGKPEYHNLVSSLDYVM